ncbi:MAG TPA: MFS transporter [Actinomycetota bacterium]|nr:MFS transporter [Actinomycetota bacterium]
MNRYRWVVLGLAIFAQMAFSAVIQGLPAMGPALRDAFDLSLPQVGLVLSALTAGGAITLVPWGMLADRFGSRPTLLIGLGGCGAALALAARADQVVLFSLFLVLAGMLGGVTSVAGGRAVLTWFSASSRGTALGLRQTAVPIGSAIGALTLPAIAAASGVDGGLFVLAASCGLAALACGLWIRGRDPADQEKAGARVPMKDPRMWRLAAATCLLAFTQLSIVTFVVLFLNEERGFTPQGAGVVLAAIQLLGAAARVGLGRWSDLVASRIIPLQRVALCISISWFITVALFEIEGWVFIALLITSGMLSVSWNALSFTAAAEYAGPGRAGTAIGMQQTLVFGAAAVVAPAFGSLVAAIDWRPAFIALGISPLLAWIVLRSLDDPLRKSESTA